MYRRRADSWMKHWDFELLDIVLMEFAFFISYEIRHMESEIASINSMYLRLAVLLFAFDIVVVFFSNNYKNILQRATDREFISVIENVSLIYLLLLVYEFIIKESYLFSRTVFLLSWGISIVFSFWGRLVLKHFLRKRMTQEKNQSKLLLITSEDHIISCVKQIRQKVFCTFKICGIALPENQKYNDCINADIPIMYGEAALMDYVRQNVVDEVLIDTFSDQEKLNKMIRTFLGMGITVHINMGFLPENLPNQLVGKIGTLNVLTTAIKAASGWKLSLKRIADIIGSLVGLLLAGIAFLIFAPIIKHQSPGPVIFKQQRIGKNGRTFYIYKFRSMYLDAEEKKKELMGRNEMNNGLMFKMEDDPRIIGSEKGPGKGIGNFLRRTSIDELPQFWNILKGEMSMVGTRPPTVNEYEKYNLKHKIRLSMSPGLTGLWQVSGRSDITDFDEVVRLDTEYIENWSLLMDFKILLKTVKVVVKRSGSK